MSGRRVYDSAHRRARRAALATTPAGAPCPRCGCPRCGHPMLPGDRLELDHRDDGPGYLGLSHASPCRTCGRKCNQRAGGIIAAELAGKKLRERRCVICGMAFTASRGTDGSESVTCSQRSCITEIRRSRKAALPDPEPPPVTGRVW
jgi:hypothetical protein